MKVTEFDKICAICGRPVECNHHLVFGFGKRSLATKDDLILPMCNKCHNMADSPLNRIHGNSMAEALSKICGQLAYEKNKVAQGATEEQARVMFMERYGVSYL